MKLNKIIIPIIFSLTIVTILSGCNHTALYDKPDDPRFAPVVPDYMRDTKKINGSLYNEKRGLALYEDIKAREVGDIITVQLTEVTSAIKSNETKLDKKSSATIIDPVILGTGPKFDIPKQLPIPLTTTDNLNLQTSINASRTFDGKGDSNQSNSLNGTITVTVTKIYPNGNLYVRGEKWVTLNTGDEFIRVSGIIRPQDIGSNNIIQSNRIADARISYSGRGDVHNAGRQGWLMKILGSKLWPI